ncbi:hypothetical protein Hdeb2414_s0108g00796831 [Helianthus debilis subsp. tardiflorus]
MHMILINLMDARLKRLHVKISDHIDHMHARNEKYTNQRNKYTFDTQGHVVSTICTCLLLNVNISFTAAPNAGRITTSPLSTTSNCFSPSSMGISLTSMSSSL